MRELGGGDRVVDLARQCVGELHRLLECKRAQAVRQVGIASGERCLDGGGVVVRRKALS